MTKRYFGGEDPEDFSFEDEDDLEESIEGFLNKNEIIDIMHIDLAQVDLNQKLLVTATHIAEKSLFWCFKSNATKLNEIKEIYLQLIPLVDGKKEE